MTSQSDTSQENGMEPQKRINPEMSVVYILESGRPQQHGGPYPQAHARNLRDDMRKHVENDNHQMWDIPKNTAHVVAITDDVLWEIEKLFHKNVVTDGGQSTNEKAQEIDENKHRTICRECGDNDTDQIDIEEPRGVNSGTVLIETRSCNNCYAGYTLKYDLEKTEVIHEPEITDDK